MPDHDKDIQELIGFLAVAKVQPYTYPATQHAEIYHAALTALVAERNELTARVRNLKAVNSTYEKIVAERDALKQRVAELESQPPAASDLRERLVESALRGAGTGAARSVRSSMLTEAEAEALGRQAVWMAEGAFDEMRKGDTNA